MYGVEAFKTLPIVSANWTVGSDRPRAHTRAIHIAFQRHDDEPGANLLYRRLWLLSACAYSGKLQGSMRLIDNVRL